MRSASREARAFRDQIARIGFLDRAMLEEAEVIAPGEAGRKDWQEFAMRPIPWILRLNDDRLDRFVELLEER